MQVADALDEAHGQRHRAPRHQERQRDADQAAAGEGARLRPGEVPAAGRPARRRRRMGVTMPRHGARHAQLHGARAAARRRGRSSRRPLRPRRRAVRDARRTAAVPGRHDGRRGRPHPQPGARGAGPLQLRRARRRRGGGAQGARQGSRVSLPVGARALRRSAPRPRAPRARDDRRPSHLTWRPGMHLPPVGFGHARRGAGQPAGRPHRGRPDLRQSHRQSRRRVGRAGHGRVAHRRLRQGARPEAPSRASRCSTCSASWRRAAAGSSTSGSRSSSAGGSGATWVVGGAVQRLGERVRITAQTIAVEEGRTVSASKIDGTHGRDLRAAGPARRGARAPGPAARAGAEREAGHWAKTRTRPRPTRPTRAAMLNLRIATQESVERAIALFEQRARARARLRRGARRARRRAAAARRVPVAAARARAQPGAARAGRGHRARRAPRRTCGSGRRWPAWATTDAAEAAIQRGLALEPDSALAHSQLARLLWLGPRRASTRPSRHFERAAALAPEAGYTHLQLALLQALSGDLDAAERSARARPSICSSGRCRARRG